MIPPKRSLSRVLTRTQEIARVALERLVQDGRIHPARIEEVVIKATKEMEQVIMEEGEKVIFDLGIHNISQEMIRALGRLHFRTSYGQNVLAHSKEVATLAGMIAGEVGADAILPVVEVFCTTLVKGLNRMGMPTTQSWGQIWLSA